MCGHVLSVSESVSMCCLSVSLSKCVFIGNCLHVFVGSKYEDEDDESDEDAVKRMEVR